MFSVIVETLQTLNLNLGSEGAGASSFVLDTAKATFGSKISTVNAIGQDYSLNISKVGAMENITNITIEGADSATFGVIEGMEVNLTADAEDADNITIEELSSAATLKLGAGADTLTLTKITGASGGDVKYREITVDFGENDGVKDTLKLGTVTGEGNVLISLTGWGDEDTIGLESGNPMPEITKENALNVLTAFGLASSGNEVSIYTWRNGYLIHRDEGEGNYLYIANNLLVALGGDVPPNDANLVN